MNNLNVMTLNLRFGLADDGPNNWSYRVAAYPDLLQAHPCDFYAFQEVNDFQLSFLSDLLTDYQITGQRFPAPDYWQNNIIFFHKRWKCIEHQHFYLSTTPDIPSKFSKSQWPRQCTIGTFACGPQKISVVDTHFDFDPEVQRRSAILICKRLTEIDPKWPVILMGDFNAGPESACLLVFQKCLQGFRSAFEPPPNGTHHGFKGHPKGKAIDWILFHGPLHICNSSMITQKYCGYYPSDHFPLTARFSWVPG